MLTQEGLLLLRRCVEHVGGAGKANKRREFRALTPRKGWDKDCLTVLAYQDFLGDLEAIRTTHH